MSALQLQLRAGRQMVFGWMFVNKVPILFYIPAVLHMALAPFLAPSSVFRKWAGPGSEV